MCNRTIFALIASGTLLAVPASAAQRWGRGPVPDAGACFYQQPNYQGRYFCAREGEDMSAIPNGLNDRIRSIRVFGGGHVIVYSDDRYGGSERWIDYNVPDLRSDGWENRISSMRLSWERRDANQGRYSDERARGTSGYSDRRPRGSSGYAEGRPRGTGGASDGNYRGDRRVALTREQAQAIVRSAYLNVLGREPDPASSGWVDHVLNDGWSQQQVETELRNSAEYRQRHPR